MCDQCGRPIPDDLMRRRAKRCSAECRVAWRNRRTAASVAFRANHPEKAYLSVRRARLRDIYGLTLEEWQAMHEAQAGACAICQRTDAKLVVDHDHRTGVVRGLLCNRCNGQLGFIENEVLMAAASDYLARSARRRLEVA